MDLHPFVVQPEKSTAKIRKPILPSDEDIKFIKHKNITVISYI